MKAMIYKPTKCCSNAYGLGTIIEITGIIENELIEVECTLCNQVQQSMKKYFIYDNENTLVEPERVKILPDLNEDEEIINQLLDLDLTSDINYINIDKL